ncbi:MAG: hypothetical protein JWM80_5109 [Cyanobacteria bacterium RYN_339]|nr:hypothetical protein [Cyanobacteria bacterium RYN_339]
MAEIKVEHEDTFIHRMERLDRRLWVPVLAIVLGLLLFWGVHAANQQRTVNAGLPSAPLAASGRVWVPMGGINLLPDRQMVKIGRTTDGRDLYNVATTGGGGGGGPALVGPVQGVARAFVRIGDDRYQQVALLPIVR